MTNDPDTSTLPTAADADTAGTATSTAATHERGRISPVAENVSEGFAQGAKPQDSERIDAVCRWLDEAGITYACYLHEASPTIEEAKLTQVMMRSASKIIILADSSKFGQRGFGRICSLEDIDVIVTDDRISDQFVTMAEEAGVDLIIA